MKTHDAERLLAIDDLDRAIVNLSAKINASTYEFLVLIREFDERAGWLRSGLENCTQWLHWRCDLSLSAARESIRMAHQLKDLPEISPAFSQGKLSYSKVRALTRVATTTNEESLLAFALSTTAARRAWTTPCCSAAGTTAWCTKAATRSAGTISDGGTSGAPTAAPFRRSGIGRKT